MVYKRSLKLCSLLFQFVFRNVSQAKGILIFQYLCKNVMYAIIGLKSFFSITLFNACMPYNIPFWRIRLYLKKKIILTQFPMTLKGLKTRKLLLCLSKNNIKNKWFKLLSKLQFFLPNCIFLNFGNVLVIQTVWCLLCVTKLLKNQVVQTMTILRKHPTNLH